MLTGIIPSEFSGMTSLTHLAMMRTSFSSIPDSIFELTNLEHFILSESNIEGTISPKISNFEKLHDLQLCCNNLTGSIPPTISSLENLYRIVFDGNSLSGTIPPLRTMIGTEEINFANNNLSGSLSGNELPSSLRYLYLGGNQLTGTIQNLPDSMEFLDLSNNLFTGSVDFISNLTTIKKASIYNTSIDSTSIPTSLHSVLVEPCHLCKDVADGNFVFANELGPADRDDCEERINAINNDDFLRMLTIDECKNLSESCVVCK